MKTGLIIAMILLIGFASLQAYLLPSNNYSFKSDLNENSYEPVRMADSDYGQKYYRKNTSHRFNVIPGSCLNLLNIDADVKVITWDKDYAEVDIMKVSTLSSEDLNDREVIVNNDGNLNISTCCCNSGNCTIIDLVIKLPEGVNLGNISNHQGNLSINKLDNNLRLCR